jgi:hypothetical protein
MFKLTGSYDLPFGIGRKYLTSGLLGRAVGNWNLSSFLFFQSGYPMGVTDTAYPNNLRAGIPRPNVLSNTWRGPTVGDTFDPDKDNFYSLGAFQRRTNPAADPFGNAPRFSGATRMFSTTRTNIAVTKAFVVRERMHADAKVEIFDLLNQKTWNRPVSQDLSSNQFGVITGASGNRTMQLGLKFVF